MSKKQPQTTDYSAFCAPGVRWEETWPEVSPGVTLRVIFFTPPKDPSLPTVLFVAGWISHVSSWERVLREMTARYRVVYAETREKVSSRVRRRARYGVEEIAGDLVRLASLLRLRDHKYILAGSSLGATAILEACSDRKMRPMGLVLVGPNAVFRVPFFGKIIITLFYPGLYLMIKPFVKWYLRTFRLDIKSDRAQYDKYCRALDAADPWKLKKAARAFWSYEVWDYLSSIDLPALIIGASKDKLHEPENLHKMCSMMPAAQYADLETNQRTHGHEMVTAFDDFVKKLVDKK